MVSLIVFTTKKKFGLIKDEYRFKKMDDMLDMLDIKKSLIDQIITLNV